MFASSRYSQQAIFTTTTKIHFSFPFLFNFCYPSELSVTISLVCVRSDYDLFPLPTLENAVVHYLLPGFPVPCSNPALPQALKLNAILSFSTVNMSTSKNINNPTTTTTTKLKDFDSCSEMAY